MEKIMNRQELMDQRKEFLEPYLEKPRTKEDILAEQQEFFGTAD